MAPTEQKHQRKKTLDDYLNKQVTFIDSQTNRTVKGKLTFNKDFQTYFVLTRPEVKYMPFICKEEDKGKYGVDEFGVIVKNE